MQQQKNAHVPKFGNWDSDGNVPYTLFFENARKGKGAGAAAGGRMINPNDPAENPEAFSVAAPSPPPGRHERRPSDAPPPPMSPNPYYAAGSPYHRHAAGEPPRRAAGYSVDQSPAHPYSSESAGYGLVASSVDRSRAKGASRGNETVSGAVSTSAPLLCFALTAPPCRCRRASDELMIDLVWFGMRCNAADEGLGGAQVRRLGRQPGVGGRLHAHLQQGEGGEADDPGGEASGVRQGRHAYQRPQAARRRRLRLIGERRA